MSRGCIKTGKGERRGVEKKISAPVSQLQKERGESLGSPISFVVPETNTRVRIVTPRPSRSAAISIRKKIAFKFNAFSSQPVRLYTLTNLFIWSTSIGRKLVHTVSNFHQNLAVKELFYVPLTLYVPITTILDIWKTTLFYEGESVVYDGLKYVWPVKG